MCSDISKNIRIEFDDLNRSVRNVSAEIRENLIAEDPLMRRNGIELLAMIVPLAAVKLINVKTSFPIDAGFAIALPIAILAGVSYFKTLQRRTPYQDKDIELGHDLKEQCKFLRYYFPRAKWMPKEGCYVLQRGERKSVVDVNPPSYYLL